jgi:hypothetical protein
MREALRDSRYPPHFVCQQHQQHRQHRLPPRRSLGGGSIKTEDRGGPRPGDETRLDALLVRAVRGPWPRVRSVLHPPYFYLKRLFNSNSVCLHGAARWSLFSPPACRPPPRETTTWLSAGMGGGVLFE